MFSLYYKSVFLYKHFKHLLIIFCSDVVKVEDGIGEKLATFTFYQSAFVGTVTMALIKGWKLALLCLISFPVTITLVGVAGLVSEL